TAYDTGATDTWFLPMAFTFGKQAEDIGGASPNAVLSTVVSPKGPGVMGSGVLHDAVVDDAFCASFLASIGSAGELRTRHGVIRGLPAPAFPALRGPAETALAVKRSSADQSNSSIVYGDRLILKLFRRQQPGPN